MQIPFLYLDAWHVFQAGFTAGFLFGFGIVGGWIWWNLRKDFKPGTKKGGE